MSISYQQAIPPFQACIGYLQSELGWQTTVEEGSDLKQDIIRNNM